MNRIQRCLAVCGRAWRHLARPHRCGTGRTGHHPGPGRRAASGPQPPIPTVVTGGMPGWQITLIALGAALLAAALAVLLDRASSRRRAALRSGT